MKTSAISPTPNASVTITPKPIASQPAPLMSESPMPVHSAAITMPIIKTTAAAITAATQLRAGFTGVLPKGAAHFMRNCTDSGEDLAITRLLADPYHRPSTRPGTVAGTGGGSGTNHAAHRGTYRVNAGAAILHPRGSPQFSPRKRLTLKPPLMAKCRP